MQDGASEIYREGNSRYVAIKYSMRGRDLGSTVEEAMQKVDTQVKLPPGYRIDWAGEYASAEARAEAAHDRRAHHAAGDLHDPLHHVRVHEMGGADSGECRDGARRRRCWRCSLTRTHFSVSSGIGFLALFGVSVQTGVIMLEYINQLRVARPSDPRCRGARGGPAPPPHHDDHAGRQRSACCRPPLSHGIGSDSQRPFAIVIVGGLIAALLLSIFLLPTLYVWVAGPDDVLPEPESHRHVD